MITLSRHARRLLLGLTLGLLVATPLASQAGAHGKDPVLGGELFDQDEVLEYKWRTGSEPPAAIRTAINAAAGDIGETLASRGATFAYAADGPNPIGYGTGTCGVNGIACFTRTAPDTFTMWLREQGRVYDWGTLKWCQMYLNPPDGCYDAETIALDEFGHIEGLGHHANYADDRDYTDAVVQTYSRTKPKAGWNMHRFGVCDVATLQVQYDIPGASSPYSTCLDIATVLALSADDTTVPYGTTVELTAVLRVLINDDYGELSNNPVSKRVVKLQRRPPGTSTWTTVATMATSTPTGSYVASLKLQSTTEFRAVFSTPTTEGLRGDVSSTVKVTVGACTVGCPQSTDQ
jgi:hypothetical protein